MMENLQLSTRKKVWLAAAVLALLMWTVLMPLRVNAAETGEVRSGREKLQPLICILPTAQAMRWIWN